MAEIYFVIQNTFNRFQIKYFQRCL